MEPALLRLIQVEYEKFKKDWSQYSGAVDVWDRNIVHVEQLYDYSSDIRRIMYTTNPIEAVHSSFRKVTKKGAFPNEDALIKLLYLRVSELSKKMGCWKSQKLVYGFKPIISDGQVQRSSNKI